MPVNKQTTQFFVGQWVRVKNSFETCFKEGLTAAEEGTLTSVWALPVAESGDSTGRDENYRIYLGGFDPYDGKWVVSFNNLENLELIVWKQSVASVGTGIDGPAEQLPVPLSSAGNVLAEKSENQTDETTPTPMAFMRGGMPVVGPAGGQMVIDEDLERMTNNVMRVFASNLRDQMGLESRGLFLSSGEEAAGNGEELVANDEPQAESSSAEAERVPQELGGEVLAVKDSDP